MKLGVELHFCKLLEMLVRRVPSTAKGVSHETHTTQRKHMHI